MHYLIVFTNCLLVTLVYFTFFYVIFGRRLNSINKLKLLFILVVFVLLYIVISLNHDFFFITNFAAVIFCYITLKMELKEFIYLVLFIFPILSILKLYFYSFLNLFPYLNDYIKKIINLFFIIISLWIYFFIIGRKKDKNAFIINSKNWFLIIAITWILAAMMSFFEFILHFINIPKAILVGNIFIIVGNLVIFFLIFAIIYYYNLTKIYQLEIDDIQKYGEQQKDYFIQLLKRETETRRFRHDINNELLELKFFCENKDYKNLEHYLLQMTENFRAIRGTYYDIGSDIANTILNYYLVPINKECEIKVHGYFSDNNHISQRDICILFSNLIKNAVEAIQRSKESKKSIFITVRQGNKYLEISIINTFEEIAMKNGILTTIKKDKRNHGFGIQNIQMIVNKYDGTYNQIIKDRKFCVYITLKM